MKKAKQKSENIDVCEGELIPINSKLQGEFFEKIKDFMSYMRYHQLIKKITYKVEIEYYSEDIIPVHKDDEK